MQALHLVYQHWFITCILLGVSSMPLGAVAYGVRGLIVSIRGGK